MFNEPDSSFSNDDAAGDLNSTAMTGSNPVLNDLSAGTYITGGADYGSTTGGMTTAEGDLGMVCKLFRRKRFSIEKSTRYLKSQA